MSVVGKQEGDRLVPYRTSNGHELLLLQAGRRTHHDIFSDELSSNRALTWWLRGAGWLLTFVGLSCLTSLLNVLGQSPCYGRTRCYRSWAVPVGDRIALVVVGFACYCGAWLTCHQES